MDEQKIERALDTIVGKLDDLEQGQKALVSKVDSLEQGQKALATKVDSLEQGQKALEQGQKALATKVDSLERGQVETRKMIANTNRKLDKVAADIGYIIARVVDSVDGEIEALREAR